MLSLYIRQSIRAYFNYHKLKVLFILLDHSLDHFAAYRAAFAAILSGSQVALIMVVFFFGKLCATKRLCAIHL